MCFNGHLASNQPVRYPFGSAIRSAIVPVALLLAGYFVGGGELGILDWFYEATWHNRLGESIHEAVLSVDDDRLLDLYSGLRMEFRYGLVAFLVGLIGAILLPSRLALLPIFLVLGIVIRRVAPVLIELAAQGKLALVPELIPDFAWDIAMLPTCALGIGIARLVRLRRLPSWRLRSAAVFTLPLALFLAAVAQRWSYLLPIAFCSLVGCLSAWLLRQSGAFAESSSNQSTQGSGGV